MELNPLPYEPDEAIDLSSINWELKFSGTFNAVFTGDKQFTPIPLQEIPVIFNSPVITVISATTAIKNPFYMGTLIQAFNLGINNGQLSNFSSRYLYSGTRSIVWRKDINSPYRLRFKPYRKLSQISILIYQLNP